jgi:DHA2 family multidrug resistance protein-like MFS transporter
MTKPTSRMRRQPGAGPGGPRPVTEPPVAPAPATATSGASPDRTARGRWWALAAVAASFLVVGLDSYIVVTALPTFSVKLGASESQLQWITAAYTLAWAALLLPIGKLGDKLGHRKVLMAGLAMFGIASVAASQVSTAGELITLRAVMGAGGAMIMPMGLAIIPVLFPEEATRRRAVTVTTAGALVSLPLGPLLGGWLLSHFAWGWIFLVNAPVATLALLGVWLLVPESRDPANPRLDWPGALLSAAGIVGVVYAVIEEPADGWHAPVLASLLGGMVLIGLFTARQSTSAAPLIDLQLFRNRLFSWGTAAFAVISFAMTGVLFILTPYLQIVQGNDAQGTGLRLLPMIAALIAAAASSEVLAARIGVRFVIPAGMILSAAGLVILADATASSGYGIVALALAVFGAGLGLGLPLAADAVLGTLAPHQTGMGNALSRTLQAVGVALGTAVLGSVLSNAYRNELAGHLAALPPGARNAALASVAGGHSIAARLPGSAGRLLSQAASTAYAHGMAHAAAVCFGLLVTCAIACLIFLPGKPPKATAPQTDPEIR